LSSRLSLTSWNTSTPPDTAPEPSRIGDAVLSMYISLPSRLMSSVGRTDLIARLRRIATDSGFSSGSQVSSWKPRKMSSMCLPAASSKRQPGELFGDRVQVLDGQVRVGGDHAVADRLQRDLRALLLLNSASS